MKNRNPHFNLRAAQAIPPAILTLALAACSTTDRLDFSAYPRIPSTPTTAAYRVAFKSNPLTSKAAFHGNYGGPGNAGGKPVDHMDELFRRHDVAYYSSRARTTMIRADQELVHQLQEIDPESLSPQGLKYRQRVINFFTSPISHAFGKPISACFRSREHPRAWVADKNALHEFFTRGWLRPSHCAPTAPEPHPHASAAPFRSAKTPSTRGRR